MINSVEIHNFKNLRDLRIDLSPLTVFVGANASGKTSVLEAIHLAVRATTGRVAEVFHDKWDCKWLYSRGGKGKLSITCTTPAGEFSVTAEPIGAQPPQPINHWEYELFSPVGVNPDDAVQPARAMVFLHLNAAQLAKPSYSDRAPPRVEFYGKGLASVLAYMALNDPDGFNALVDAMRELIPHLRRIRFGKDLVHRLEKEYVKFGDDTVERRVTRDYQGDSILFDFQNADNVSAHTVSEGTLMLLGLLTVLLAPTRPDILLMDDIEHGLHPLAQKSLLGVLRKVMQTFPNLQILASAHSPYLLDELQPEEIRMMAIGDDGYAVCGRLQDHPQFEKWKNEMAPGELWSLFGEKWVAAGETAK